MISSGFFNYGKRLLSHWEQEDFTARLLSHDMVYDAMSYVDDIPISSPDQDVLITGRRFEGYRGRADNLTFDPDNLGSTGNIGVIRTIVIFQTNTGKLMCAVGLPPTTITASATLTIKWAAEGVFTFDDHDLVEDVTTWFIVAPWA